MTVRTYRHSVTGRQVQVADGSRMAELVKADGNYSEVTSESKAPAKKTTRTRRKK